MKGTILVTILLLLSLKIYSQDTITSSFGAKAGISFGSPIGKSNGEGKGFLQIGTCFGGYYSYALSPKTTLSTELTFTQKKGRYEANIGGDTIVLVTIPGKGDVPLPASYKGTAKGGFNNLYLEWPIVLNYHFKRLSINGGLYNAFILKRSHTGNTHVIIGDDFREEDSTFDDSEFISKHDFGVLLGSEYSLIKDNKLNIGYRTSYGLKSIFTNDYTNIKNKFANLYMSFYITCRII